MCECAANEIMELNETRQSYVATTISAANLLLTDNDDDDENLVTTVASDVGVTAAGGGYSDTVSQFYGKLMKQSLMNTFNVNDEFIESTTLPDTGGGGGGGVAVHAMTIVLIFKCFVIGFIILAAIFGNMLIMVSVMQHRKLR